MTKYKIKDYVIIIDIGFVNSILDIEIFSNLNIKEAKELQNNIYSKAVFDLLINELGYLITYSKCYDVLDNRYLKYIRIIKDNLYKNIITNLNLNINANYYVTPYIVNDNLHILISTWSENE